MLSRIIRSMVDLTNVSFFAAATRAHACNTGMNMQSEIALYHRVCACHLVKGRESGAMRTENARALVRDRSRYNTHSRTRRDRCNSFLKLHQRWKALDVAKRCSRRTHVDMTAARRLVALSAAAHAL